MPDFKIEKRAMKRGFRFIAGVDEAGRGALFGPVIAASVIFPGELIKKGLSDWLTEIDDSKALSPRKRKRLLKDILANAASVGWGMATPFEVDQENIYRASLKAMKRAVENMPLTPDYILVDGFNINNVNYPQKAIRQGDKKSITIAAASIMAKVLRDEMMAHLDKIFEGYGLGENKGYGTKKHYHALKERGPSLFHRRTFRLE